jgi:hypothetical protein
MIVYDLDEPHSESFLSKAFGTLFALALAGILIGFTAWGVYVLVREGYWWAVPFSWMNFWLGWILLRAAFVDD